MAFRGFTDETLPWFDGLTRTNTRDYFTANRPVYDRAVHQPLLDLLTELSVHFGGSPKLFRQNRDVRFSADKSPYKTTASGVLQGCPNTMADLYLSVSADGLHAATGCYDVAKDQLTRFRQALTTDQHALENGASLREILAEVSRAGLEVDGAPLKSLPRGVAKDAPNTDLVRFRSLTASAFLEPERMNDASVVGWVTERWTTALPMNAWLDTHVGPSTLALEERC